MSKRLIASALLVILGIAIALLERGPIGGLLGPFFIVAALLIWAIPPSTFANNPFRGEEGVNPILLTVAGISLGLLAATLGAFLLPSRIFSWLLLLVGVAMIGWLVLRWRR